MRKEFIIVEFHRNCSPSDIVLRGRIVTQTYPAYDAISLGTILGLEDTVIILEKVMPIADLTEQAVQDFQAETERVARAYVKDTPRIKALLSKFPIKKEIVFGDELEEKP